ncbi:MULTISPECIES: accessory factor UbiK family protein [Halomonadaceae]|uniref:accessory factor UbiK family protein n=1 Tax=Halomonadaceae TaxID=28256 RepID=UPI00159A2D09|nr:MULTISPECIES: accessory factor UbiK family protein [Halomonas]QJQ95485.1 accessory factor UbiK family protein [Halomonas sp. PA5]
MSRNDFISRFAQQLGERLQDASHAPEELQKSMQHLVRGAVDRLELVSREDFDILMEVLQRTRRRVEALERQVTALEASLAERDAGASVSKTLPGAMQEDHDPAEDAGAGEASR